MLNKKREKTSQDDKILAPATPRQNDVTPTDDDEIYDIVNELSSEKILEKKERIKKLSEKLKEIEKEKDEINEELNKGNKFRELQESFDKAKNEFVFKVTFDDGIFYENTSKKYISAILKNVAKQQKVENMKIIQYKTLQNYLWFKLNEKLVIKWMYKKVDSRSEHSSGFMITQLRSESFFNDI